MVDGTERFFGLPVQPRSAKRLLSTPNGLAKRLVGPPGSALHRARLNDAHWHALDRPDVTLETLFKIVQGQGCTANCTLRV